MWNELIKLRDKTKNSDTKKQAESLLSALNTAGGKEIMKREVENFLNQHR